MTKSGQAKSYKAYAERDAGNGPRDAFKKTVKIEVRARGVGGFAIAHLGDSKAHSSCKD